VSWTLRLLEEVLTTPPVASDIESVMLWPWLPNASPTLPTNPAITVLASAAPCFETTLPLKPTFPSSPLAIALNGISTCLPFLVIQDMLFVLM